MNSWQAWLLLRPLIVFAMACPFFVFAALLGLRKKPPETEKCTEAPADQSPRFTLSDRGTWRIQADGLSQSVFSSDPVSATQKRAA
jgi:hypothetical protein